MFWPKVWNAGALFGGMPCGPGQDGARLDDVLHRLGQISRRRVPTFAGSLQRPPLLAHVAFAIEGEVNREAGHVAADAFVIKRE